MEYVIGIIFGAAYTYISSRYGWRTLRGAKNWHNGIDIATGGKNLPMSWFCDGIVIAKGYGSAAGNYLYISCPSIGKKFYLYHMKTASPLNVGDNVNRGTFFGYCGTTGNSTGVHLHISVVELKTGDFVDPEIFFKEYEQMDSISPISSSAIRLIIGGSTGADTKAIKSKLEELQIDYSMLDGGVFVTNNAVTAGDQVFILRVTSPLGVSCTEYKTEVVIDIRDLQAELAKLTSQNEELEKALADVNEKCTVYMAALKEIEHTALSAVKGA